jgi:hypothetical protein
MSRAYNSEMKSSILKIRKLVTEHPTLVTIGLGLAITLAIGAVIGVLDYHQAYAYAPPPCRPSNPLC